MRRRTAEKQPRTRVAQERRDSAEEPIDEQNCRFWAKFSTTCQTFFDAVSPERAVPRPAEHTKNPA